MNTDAFPIKCKIGENMSQDTNATSEAQSVDGNETDQQDGSKESKSIDQKINSAISNHMGRLEKKLEKMLSAKVASQQPAAAEEVVSEKEELKRQVKLLLEKDKARETELRQQRMMNALTDQLQKNGISHVKQAAGFLVDTEKSVRFNEDGELVMKVNGIEQDLPTAIKEWASMDDAKLYLAPKNVNGAGSGKVSSTASPKKSTSEMTKDEIAEALITEIFS